MAFNINNFLNTESKQVIKSDFKTVKISIHKLRQAPDKENFYHMDDEEIETTARTIELVGIQQNLVVKPIEDTDEYEIITGNKRSLAVLKLLAEGKTEFEMVPCKIEETGDDIRNELILIFTNSTQRDRTDYERMKEIKRVKELLEEYKKDNKLTGRKQEIIAAVLGTSKSQVGRLENIDHNLIEEFKNEFAAGRINTSTANEIAGLDQEAQKALYETYKETGSLTAKDAKEKKTAAEDEQITGQDNIINHPEYLPDNQIQTQQESDGYTDFEPDPDKVNSICFGCLHWSECDQKGNTVINCKDYINKTEAYKTDKEREQEEYDRQQAAIDKQTKGKLEQQADNEKMNNLPSDEGQKEHDIKLAAMYFGDVQSGKKSFELRKNDRHYKVGDFLNMHEYSDGKDTGRSIYAEIVYMIEDYNGLEEGYCILGTKILDPRPLEKEQVQSNE
jgi:ParB family chromosome partitioning protein